MPMSKGVDKYAQMRVVVNFFSVSVFFCRSKNVGFPAVWEVPGRFRKLREAWEKNFHRFSCKFIGGISSYDPKPSEVNDYKSNDYFNVSVIGPIHSGV